MRAPVLALLALAACDARATTAAAPARADLKSRELESCAATIDCQDGLRCFEQTCQRVDRSVLGDFHAAVAERALAAGDIEGALTAYGEALSRYGADNLTTPVELDCGYGRALVKAKANRERAELAARVLHRCLNATPVGAPLRAVTMTHLAALLDAGLEPQHLASETAADVFLSRQAASPSTDKLVITVAGSPTPTGKSWPNVSAQLGGADLRAPLIGCWEQHFAAAHKPALAVSFGLRARYAQNPDYEDEGRWTVTLEAASGLSGAAAAADACVRAVVEPVLKKAEGVRDSFQTRVTLSIK